MAREKKRYDYIVIRIDSLDIELCHTKEDAAFIAKTHRNTLTNMGDNKVIKNYLIIKKEK